MIDVKDQVIRLKADAARCERLGVASYNPALSAQLLAYASEFRHRAATLERAGRAF